MDPEHQEPTTDKSDVDPSIDPKVLVEQEGDDAGRIAAVETSDGTYPENKPELPYLDRPPVVEGLPRTGAEAEENMRNRLSEVQMLPDAPANEALGRAFNEATRDMGGDKDKAIETIADKAGTEAMAAEVSKRATEFAKEKYPQASPELIEKFAQKAAEKFKAELEAKGAEKKAEHDSGVQGLIDSLDAPDTPLSAVVPEGTPEPEV